MSIRESLYEIRLVCELALGEWSAVSSLYSPLRLQPFHQILEYLDEIEDELDDQDEEECYG